MTNKKSDIMDQSEILCRRANKTSEQGTGEVEDEGEGGEWGEDEGAAGGGERSERRLK